MEPSLISAKLSRRGRAKHEMCSFGYKFVLNCQEYGLKKKKKSSVSVSENSHVNFCAKESKETDSGFSY